MDEVRKHCKGCRKLKALKDFSPDKRKKFGRSTLCKACRADKCRAIALERYHQTKGGYVKARQEREYERLNAEIRDDDPE